MAGRRIPTVIIGAGHAGLAMSRCLSDRGIEHVLLERGEVGQSWRTQRWDSFRMLTPRWQARLPGHVYEGGDPDGFATAGEFVGLLERYAANLRAPVEQRTTVTTVGRDGDRFRVVTDRGEWQARTLVVASGASALPSMPAVARALPGGIESLTAHGYRAPDQLPAGGVLVVGASASGVQIAQELHRSGRPITIAVGEHVRAPRRYRGRDILRWMDVTGLHAERYDEVDDIRRARRLPSFQLAGTDDGSTIDLNALRREGVRIVGRLVGFSGTKVQFSGALRTMCTLADQKMNRLLQRIDDWVDAEGVSDGVDPPDRPPATEIDERPLLELDLVAEDIRSVVWATGFRPDFSWLRLPVFDRKGRMVHDGGVLPDPGACVMGLQFLRRRNSGLVDGAAADARELSSHLAAHLARL